MDKYKNTNREIIAEFIYECYNISKQINKLEFIGEH